MNPNSHSPGVFRRTDLPLALLAAIVLLFSLFYTLSYVLFAPYPGVDFNSQWEVLAFDNPCESDPDWCAARNASLRIGDQFTRIGDLTYDDYRSNLLLVPFGSYLPGDVVPITVLRDGREVSVNWEMLGPTPTVRFGRLISLLILLPFWLAGTSVLIFLRPRDRLWLLLIAFNYVTTAWIATGIPSVHHIAGCAFFLHVTTWLFVPIYLHLHLLVPTASLQRRYRPFIVFLYAIAVVLILADFVKPLPASAYNLALLIAALGSIVALIVRYVRRPAPNVRLALRFMLVGIGLAFVPAMILWIIPSLVSSSTAGRIPIIVMTIALSLLPLFYVYAIYKHRLGDLEVRANRLLSQLGFLVLFTTTFLFVFVIGSQWIAFNSEALAFALIISIVFITLGLPLKAPFQRFIDRLAYGTEHDPDSILRTFAEEIPRALDRPALVKLLTQDITASLLIHQSALYLLRDHTASLLYADQVELDESAPAPAELRGLLAETGRYRPPEHDRQGPFEWVRLPIAVQVRGRAIGLWLLGRRDPDDYYPRADVELLTALGNQIGVALENARLFEDLRRRTTELETAYSELQELDRLKDEFVQNVSHELRTPLTLVQGYTELVLEEDLGPLTPDQHDALATIADRAADTIRLVNDVLILQQVAVNKGEYEDVNVRALARSCVQAMEIVVRQREKDQLGHTFVFEAAEDTPAVSGDRGRLRQVFDNLLQNAVKFSPAGGAITVRVRSCSYRFDADADGQPRPAVEASISDQGTGIPADQLDRIWERFYQVDGSTTRRFGGAGLGLAIVRSIVETHGGAVRVESKLGAGSEFFVILPAISAPPQP